MAEEALSDDSPHLHLKPIGYASTWFRVKNGTPRQPTVSSLTRGSIKITKETFSNPEQSLENLSQFSHVWIIFIFHKNSTQRTKPKVAPPRLDGKRVGVFSTRSPHRPNAVGLTLAKIMSLEGDTLHLCGLDLLDMTPIIDIKPYIPSYDAPQLSDYEHAEFLNDQSVPDEKSPQICSALQLCSEDVQQVSVDETTPVTVASPAWTSLGKQTIKVTFTTSSLEQIDLFSPTSHCSDYRLTHLKSSDEAIRAITDILKEDPRSVYRRNKCQDRLYFCIVDAMHVTTWFDEVNGKCEVLRVMPYSLRSQAAGHS